MVRVTCERVFALLTEEELPVSVVKFKKLAVINSITDLEVLDSKSFDVTLSLNCWTREHWLLQVVKF
jgi:hypothetical protein